MLVNCDTRQISKQKALFSLDELFIVKIEIEVPAGTVHDS